MRIFWVLGAVLVLVGAVVGADKKLRVNHEGRALPEMPAIRGPVMFNTAEADAILSAMQVMPRDNPWNEDVSGRPVLANSDKMIAGIGRNKRLAVNMDMAFVIVPANQKRVEVRITDYADESDKGPFPVPENAPIENWPLEGGKLEALQAKGEGDRHVIVVDPVNGKVHEFWRGFRDGKGWRAACAATFDLGSNSLRPAGWTSSDAAGLPIFPAVVRYDEVERGMVEHAMRFTVSKTRRAYIYPATHFASKSNDPDLPAMGQRFRLKATADLRGLSKHALAVAKGLQKYGMIVADNGGDWRISVAPDSRIKGMEELRRFTGADFEVIQTTGAEEGPRKK